MAKIPKHEHIDYLVERKFPLYKKVRASQGVSNHRVRDGFTPEFKAETLSKGKAYIEELKSKSEDELLILYQAEQAKYFQEIKAKAALEEKKRFFNQPSATADFEHWSKAAYWRIDEAIALAFGKAPEKVNLEKMKPLTGVSSAATEYVKVHDLASRAVHWKQLFDPVLPGIFLAWAKRNDIDVPQELVEQVEKRGIVIADWKDMYDKLKDQYDNLKEGLETHVEARGNVIAEWEDMYDKLKNQYDNLIQKQDKKDELFDEIKSKPLQSKERNSLLIMIAALCKEAGIDYNKKGVAVAIEKMTENLGTPLTDDTIRKVLHQIEDALASRSK